MSTRLTAGPPAMQTTELTPSVVAAWQAHITRQTPRAVDLSRRIESSEPHETYGGISLSPNGSHRTLKAVRYGVPTSLGAAFCTLHSPVRFERTLDDLRTDPVEFATVCASATRGPSMVKQFGRENWFASGDLVVVPTTSPFVQELPSIRDIAGLLVELRHFGRFRYLAERPRRSSGDDTPLARATASFVRAFAIDIAVSGTPMSSDADLAAVDLICAALAELVEDDRYELQDDTLFQRQSAIDLIERRHRDPSLTPDVIAEALFISRRHLYRLFSDDEKSLATMIADARVSTGRHLMETSPHTPIGDVAAASGYRSPATFRNQFKVRYGISPRDFRESQEQTAPSTEQR